MKKSNKIAVAVLSVLLLCVLVVSGIFLWKNYFQTTVVNGDVSWYDENGEEFTITTVEQFYGVAELSKTHDFKGQTIKLGADIEVNEGNAVDWSENVPEHRWIPINGFAGKFDGQGHTISGIYGDSIITSLGLFTDTQKGCVIKDLKLVNSFFKNNNDKGTGSIIGFGGGKLENIYCDAILKSSGKYIGGLIGRVTAKGENQITNCWFDGTITTKGTDSSEVGGLVGAFTVEDALNAVQHCLSTADIACHGVNVGGLCGNVGSGSFLNLIDSMYTGTLDYNADKYDKVGSVIGQITDGSTAIIKDTYTIDELANRTIGTNGGYQEGSAIAVGAVDLKGLGGYQWTTLDFDTYWAVQTEDTPILIKFADSSVSVAGVDRLVDLSWYNPTGKKFVITNAKEFYGFAYLSRSYDFSGQTIMLGADITINEGNAENWQKEAPKYKWTPIAWHGTSLSKRFKGNFDGQGYTISGVYCKGDESDGYIGLFGEIYHGSVVKNFKVVNSYFEGVMPSNVRGTVGTICGRLRGTIDSVYSSAIVVNSAKMTGGIAGMINGTGQNTISNCWFDGKVTGSSRTGGILGGVYGNKASIEATIEHCLNTGDIAVQLGKGDVGGICGMAETWCTLYIKDCLNTGTFKTVGEGKKANTHIGTIFGSVTETNDVGSRVEISNSFGTKEFYSRLVGWKFDKEGIKQTSVSFVNEDEVKGYGGYQWTTLDFKNSWAVRTTDVPIPVVFATSRPSVNGVARLVDFSWFDAEKDVYTIKDYKQLYAAARLWDVINQFKGKTIKLGADISFNKGNASDWAANAPALVWEPMRFNGTFDGQGHKISGIYVKGGEEDNYVGLFYRIYKDGTVKNLKLTNSYIEGTMPSNKRGAVGSIAGRSNGVIDAVYSDAIVVNSARMTGGIVGMMTGEGVNKISNAWFDGSLTGITRMGGIIGGVYGNKEDIQVSLEHCLNSGDITVQIGYGDVGGLCGMVETGGTLNLVDSLNAGTFRTIGDDKKANTHIGTLVGSVTKTDEVSSKVIMKHVYGTEEFYSKLVGWSYSDKAVTKSSVAMMDRAKITGDGGRKWTTLDFSQYWVTRTDDVPVLLALTKNASSTSGVESMVDLSWYDENSDEYTITTLQQLYGFNLLCDNEHDYFEGKTVKLGADITMNKGDADAWGEKTPANTWVPTNFKGIFDGQGHTIRGVYVKSDGAYTGFFATLQAGAVVKNMNLENSYIEGTGEEGKRNAVGSIAGRNHGTIDTVKCDAIVVNSALMTGGIAGMTTSDDTDNVIKNCWFDGQIYANGSTGGILGGTYKSTATIERCLNTGALNINEGSTAVGGLCGFAQSTSDLVLIDSLNAGSYVKVGEGTVKQVGSILGGLHADAVLDADDVYGNLAFAAKKFGYNGGTSDVSNCAGRDLKDIEGYGAYQWMTLDFEDTDKDNVHWVLRKNEIPVLNLYKSANLSVADAKGLEDYTWYDAELSELHIDTYAELDSLTTLYNADKSDFEGKTVILGEKIKEIVIDSKEELLLFNILCNEGNEYLKGRTVKLNANVTLNEVAGDNDAAKRATTLSWGTNGPDTGWTPVTFSGTFEGQGNRIIGLYINNDEEVYTGFFNNLHGTVNNLKFEYGYMEGKFVPSNKRLGVGTVAGRNYGIIDTVYSNIVVKNAAQMTGGIVGYGETGSQIKNSWFDGDIYSVGSTGGILGGAYSETSTVKHCLNTGSLHITSGEGVGGIIGRLQGSSEVTVEDCLSVGTDNEFGDEVTAKGAVVGSVASGSSITLTHAYGVNDFAEDLVGSAVNDKVTRTKSSVRKQEQLKDTAVYQWTTLDFEDNAESEEDDKYWVLVKDKYPELAVFSSADDTKLLTDAKELLNFTWYDPNVTEYTISTNEKLLEFNMLCGDSSTNNFAGKTVKLGADITLNKDDTWKVNVFRGTFDGNWHTLSGVQVIGTEQEQYVGLFSRIYASGIVQNLILKDSSFEGNYTGKEAVYGVGSIAGRNNGVIQNVHSSATVKNSRIYTGGIAGIIYEGTDNNTVPNKISNCWYDGTIYSSGKSGGILGGAHTALATVEHCLNSGTTNILSGAEDAVGGLVGYVRSGAILTLNDSLNVGTYEEPNEEVKQIGTAVGAHNSTGKIVITDVYGIDSFCKESVGPVLFGYSSAKNITRTTSAYRSAEQLQGKAAYQWTTLDFEDVKESEGEAIVNDKYWVLIDGQYPALRVFNSTDDTALLTEAKQLTDYTWYADDIKTYTISTADQLYKFNECCNEVTDWFKDKVIQLGDDITLNSVVGETDAAKKATVLAWRSKAPSNKWSPISLKGTFDGQGHTISGIYVKSTATYTGLFNTLYNGAIVTDLKIVNSYFEGNGSSTRSGVGSVAGRNNGTIDTVYSDAVVINSKQMTGGIVGMSVDAGENCVKNCWFNGTIYASNNSVGGIQGGAYKTSSLVEHCLNTGVLNIEKGTGIGGLFGNVQDASNVTLKDSLNAGEYKKGTGSVKQLGSIVGPIGNKATLNVSNVYGISEFNTNKHGWISSGTLNQVENTAYDVLSKENYYARGASGLTFYASADDLTNSDPRTCWWIARDGKIPMLADFKTLADTLGK